VTNVVGIVEAGRIVSLHSLSIALRARLALSILSVESPRATTILLTTLKRTGDAAPAAGTGCRHNQQKTEHASSDSSTAKTPAWAFHAACGGAKEDLEEHLATSECLQEQRRERMRHGCVREGD
jgi:hypothetical protein